MLFISTKLLTHLFVFSYHGNLTASLVCQTDRPVNLLCNRGVYLSLNCTNSFGYHIINFIEFYHVKLVLCILILVIPGLKVASN